VKNITPYILIILIVIILIAYSVLINWRPYKTDGLFNFECCSWSEYNFEKE
jgi:hypothetical protein